MVPSLPCCDHRQGGGSTVLYEQSYVLLAARQGSSIGPASSPATPPLHQVH